MHFNDVIFKVLICKIRHHEKMPVKKYTDEKMPGRKNILKNE